MADLDPRTLRWAARRLRRESTYSIALVISDIKANGREGNIDREVVRAWGGCADEFSRQFITQARAIERKRKTPRKSGGRHG